MNNFNSNSNSNLNNKINKMNLFFFIQKPNAKYQDLLLFASIAKNPKLSSIIEWQTFLFQLIPSTIELSIFNLKRFLFIPQKETF